MVANIKNKKKNSAGPAQMHLFSLHIYLLNWPWYSGSSTCLGHHEKNTHYKRIKALHNSIKKKCR